MENFEQLKRDLKHENWSKRREAIWAVGKSGHPESIRLLRERLLVEPDEDCICAIVATLTGNGGFDDKSFVALNSRLEEKAPRVLISVAKAAERLPEDYYVKIKPVLVEHLSEQLSLDDNIDITNGLVHALSHLDVTVERMVKLLQTNPKFTNLISLIST